MGFKRGRLVVGNRENRGGDGKGKRRKGREITGLTLMGGSNGNGNGKGEKGCSEMAIWECLFCTNPFSKI